MCELGEWNGCEVGYIVDLILYLYILFEVCVVIKNYQMFSINL